MDPENINWRKAGYWKRLVLTSFVYLLDLFSSYLIELKLCEGRAEVTESYQQTVKERCALIKDMHMNWSSARVLSDLMEKIPNNELISSIAYIIFCVIQVNL